MSREHSQPLPEEAPLEGSASSQEEERRGSEDEEGSEEPPVGSKRQRKAEAYGGKEGMQEYWRQKKAAKKERDRLKKVEAKEAKTGAWEQLTDEEKEALRQRALVFHEERRELQAATHAQLIANMQSPTVPTLLFDVSFEGIMTPGDVTSTIAQLQISYVLLKKQLFNLRPAYVGYGSKDGLPVAPLETPVDGDGEAPPVAPESKIGASLSWEGFNKNPPIRSPLHWLQWVSEEQRPHVVYLSADSDTVLTELEPQGIYIIGCFVDHNSKKGFTHRIATELGVRTARLPLQETLIKMGNLCKVLTINHVTEVMATFQATGSWADACKCLPVRRELRADRQKARAQAAQAPQASSVESEGAV
jgi:tRNA (guanine9-N1)-methyltransferase